MKISETLNKYKAMKQSEIDKEITGKNREIAILRLEVAAKKNKNYSAISKKKKEIARLLTIKNQNKDK